MIEGLVGLGLVTLSAKLGSKSGAGRTGRRLEGGKGFVPGPPVRWSRMQKAQAIRSVQRLADKLDAPMERFEYHQQPNGQHEVWFDIRMGPHDPFHNYDSQEHRSEYEAQDIMRDAEDQLRAQVKAAGLDPTHVSYGDKGWLTVQVKAPASKPKAR